MRKLLKRAIKERYIVTLDTGESFSGLLANADELNIELVDCKYFAAGSEEPSKADGTIYLERTRVLYLQRP